MAVLNSGMFGRARGKTSGLVFAEARTKRGKKGTVRELVIPTNPNTPSQASARGKFASAQKILKTWGAEVYRNRFNRARGQLTGFMSLKSLVMNIIGVGSTGLQNYTLAERGLDVLGECNLGFNFGSVMTWSVEAVPGQFFPEGGRIWGLFAFTNNDDWDDPEQVYAQAVKVEITNSTTDLDTLDLGNIDGAPNMDSGALVMVFFYVEGPENSLRASSQVGFAGGIRGEIQDMKIKR